MFEKDQEVEVLFRGHWECGAIVADFITQRELKRRDGRLYEISAAPWHRIRFFLPSEIRYPSKYPTRKSVWTIQEFQNEKWEISKLSFDRERRWTHDLATVLHVFRVNKDWPTFTYDFRAYNHQSGEQILGAALTHE